MLVVERHDVAVGRERGQVLGRAIIAQDHIGGYLGRALIQRGREHAEVNAQFRGRTHGHPGQLTGADHADDGRPAPSRRHR